MAILIRQATPADGGALARILEPYIRETAISFHETSPSSVEMSEKIGETLERYPYLVAEDNGQIIGSACGGSWRTKASYRWSVELGIYLSPTHHQRGIGTSLYRHLLRLLTAQGFTMAYAGVTLPNAASIRLHESAGFTRVGVFHAAGCKFGKWHDVGWWERRLNELRPSPPEVIPWADMPAIAPVMLH